jgi:hypothetical protein
MTERMMAKFTALAAAFLSTLLFTTPVQANTAGGGPYGDIDGYYTWEINGKGWTVYSQNGYSWVYDDSGNRNYLDAYGNRLYGVTPAAARTITELKLTYNSTQGGVTVYQNPDGKLYTVDANGIVYAYGTAPVTPPVSGNDLVVRYAFNSADGYIVYKDPYGNLWFFGEGYFPIHYWGTSAGSYQTAGNPDRIFRYAYVADGHTLYRDDAGRLWWFENDTAHLYNGKGQGFNPTPAPSGTDVDWKHTNTMWADGKSSTVYVGQFWVAPTTVSWCPEGTHLLGWDYAEGTDYVRWHPGAAIRNTGNDLTLYPVYSH